MRSTFQKAHGEVDIRTGGGEVHVSDSRLNGNVSTGGGIVRIEGVTGDLSGKSGSGPVIYTGSSGTTIRTEDGVNIVGVRTAEPNVSVGVSSGSGSGSGSGSTTTRSGTTTTTYSNQGVGLGIAFGASGIRMNSAGGGSRFRQHRTVRV